MGYGRLVKLAFGDIEIKCSSTDRVVFPDAGVTKGDVIEYYQNIGEVMLRETGRRPVTLERFNKGITGDGYFQKHIPKYFPGWIERVTVQATKKVTHAVCTKVADLVYMANQNSLTFHIPTCRSDRLDAPDRIIFDLDPPPDRFDLVVEAAHQIRALWDELGLTAFCKTTGSKGLHVVAPLDGSAGYSEVNRFASACAELLAARHPDTLTTEFYKKDRGERLYLDTARNHTASTAAAPYSLRARPGAPVSAPVAWDEVGGDLAPDGITLGSIRSRIDEIGDLWADLDERATPLGPALERLEAAAAD